MIIVMSPEGTEEDRQRVIREIEGLDYQAHVIYGVERTVIACVGHEDKTPLQHIKSMHNVEQVIPILKPFKLASLEFKHERTEVNVQDLRIGGEQLTIIAGPCTVESEQQIMTVAQAVKKSGAKFLRGGVFRPQTSPYDFQGLQLEGLRLLDQARKETGLKIVTDVVSIRELDDCLEYADLLHISERNCQNFPLLKEIGMSKKPVLFERGIATTVKEYLQAAEYMLSEGNYNVILCQRGIRTFEDSTTCTLDLSAVAVIKSQCHLPLIVDPCCGTGYWRYVKPMSRAAIAAGADGLMIEVHPNPETAAADGPQSLTPKNFEELMQEVKKVAQVVDRKL